MNEAKIIQNDVKCDDVMFGIAATAGVETLNDMFICPKCLLALTSIDDNGTMVDNSKIDFVKCPICGYVDTVRGSSVSVFDRLISVLTTAMETKNQINIYEKDVQTALRRLDSILYVVICDVSNIIITNIMKRGKDGLKLSAIESRVLEILSEVKEEITSKGVN